MTQSIYNGIYLPQQVSDRNGACERLSSFGGYAVGANQNLISGITGKKIYVPFICIQPLGAAPSVVTFKTSGGVKLHVETNDPTEIDLPIRCLILPYNPIGWIEAETGLAILIDVTGGSCNISVPFYPFIP